MGTRRHMAGVMALLKTWCQISLFLHSLQQCGQHTTGYRSFRVSWCHSIHIYTYYQKNKKLYKHITNYLDDLPRVKQTVSDIPPLYYSVHTILLTPRDKIWWYYNCGINYTCRYITTVERYYYLLYSMLSAALHALWPCCMQVYTHNSGRV